MLWRALGHVVAGSYVDVGAQHPVTDSVSLAFYERGWRGIHVEPSAHYAKLLRQHRPDEVVVEAAVCQGEDPIPYFEFAESGYGTCDANVADGHVKHGLSVNRLTVPAVSLADVLERHAEGPVHWMKVDVEGFEHEVLRGWKPSSVRPWIVVIESVHPLTRCDQSAHWEPGLTACGYEFAHFDGLNRFYVAREHPELMSAFTSGPNVFDEFALSGTASAPFCALLNERLAAFPRIMEDQRLRLVEYAHNLRRWHNADREAWAVEQAETGRYIASLKEWGAGAEAYAKSLEIECERLRTLLTTGPAPLVSAHGDPAATEPMSAARPASGGGV